MRGFGFFFFEFLVSYSARGSSHLKISKTTKKIQSEPFPNLFFSLVGRENITEKYLKLKCFSLIFHESRFCFEVSLHQLRSITRCATIWTFDSHFQQGRASETAQRQHLVTALSFEPCEEKVRESSARLNLNRRNFSRQAIFDREIFVFNNLVTSNESEDQVQKHKNLLFISFTKNHLINWESWNLEAPRVVWLTQVQT